MSLPPASLPWLAAHELRLAWRDTMAMMTGGRRVRLVGWIVGGGLIYGLMLVIAWFTLKPWVVAGPVIDKQALVLISGTGLLFWAVTLSQALEAVTRVYYGRSDLDLILSSPTSSDRLFAVRAGTVFLSTTALGALLISPIVLSLAIQDGPHWLSAFLVLVALAALSVAIAMAITRLLFRLVGPRRTRLAAQIVAGIVGAGFVIGIQAAAILSHDGFSRLAYFQSAEVIASAPAENSMLWIPARAALGEPLAATVLVGASLAILLLAVMLIAPSYGRLAASAAGATHVRSRRRLSNRTFTAVTQRQALRRKEWKLLQRDPWLLSQTLMQLLYLVPPALLLWINYGSGAGDGTFIVVVPVIVMASGQLAGGLAWLAISGEDAHDLVATAPLNSWTILRAKIEAVLAVIVAVLTPLLILVAVASWPMALICAACALAAAAASTAIQLWFRVVAKRSMFRRRQVASRAATLCEAFSSILWAATGALWAAGSILAIGPAMLALCILGSARLIAPRN
ncbi:ABC-2 type transport system permease protein [Devosia lucknowensis]|uniref:ABC-2 type transport system permease protein n=1 Tax=Devosia lucknowensis TaxID=1096929 RepID=A0A1Y6FA76_9HYPH|nr:permease [Devosia lucknowensis]SMQ70260.1 ABC-2 type transport system permease protein [Devosia lucknowensis]